MTCGNDRIGPERDGRVASPPTAGSSDNRRSRAATLCSGIGALSKQSATACSHSGGGDPHDRDNGRQAPALRCNNELQYLVHGGRRREQNSPAWWSERPRCDGARFWRGTAGPRYASSAARATAAAIRAAIGLPTDAASKSASKTRTRPFGPSRVKNPATGKESPERSSLPIRPLRSAALRSCQGCASGCEYPPFAYRARPEIHSGGRRAVGRAHRQPLPPR